MAEKLWLAQAPRGQLMGDGWITPASIAWKLFAFPLCLNYDECSIVHLTAITNEDILISNVQRCKQLFALERWLEAHVHPQLPQQPKTGCFVNHILRVTI